MTAQRGLKTVCVRGGSRATRRRRGNFSWRGSYLAYGQDMLKCTRARLEREMVSLLPTAAWGCVGSEPPTSP